jgi:hypothetical protein
MTPLKPDDTDDVPEDVRDQLKQIARAVRAGVPPGWGYALLLFEYDKPNGNLIYTSSASRPDMIKTLRELVDEMQAEADGPCPPLKS